MASVSVKANYTAQNKSTMKNGFSNDDNAMEERWNEIALVPSNTSYSSPPLFFSFFPSPFRPCFVSVWVAVCRL